MESISHLKVIMDLLKIKVKDIVEILYVDYSMVSKWRSGARSLKPGSDFARQLCEYLMEADEKTAYSRIKGLLADEYENVRRMSPVELNSALLSWLCAASVKNEPAEPNSKVRSFSEQLTVYCYAEGRQKAAFRILQELDGMEDGQEFLIFDREESSWKSEQSRFYEKRTLEYGGISKKHTLTIIHTLNASRNQLTKLIEHDLIMNLTGKANSYYLPISRTSDFLSDMLIIKGKAALVCRYNPESEYGHYAEYHTNQRSVRYNEQLFYSLLCKAEPFYSRFYSYNRNKLTDILYKQAAINQNAFMVSPYPGFITMPEEVVNKYIGKYAISHHARKTGVFFSRLRAQWLMSLRNAGHRHICCLKEIAEFNENAPCNNDFCSFFEFPKHITNEDFCLQLKNIITLIEEKENFEMALVNELPVFGQQNVSMILRENSNAFFYSTDRATGEFMALATNDPTIEYSLYDYYEQYWESIPPLQKDRAWVTSKLKNVVAQLLSSSYKADTDK